jgi:hypothetical protein
MGRIFILLVLAMPAAAQDATPLASPSPPASAEQVLLEPPEALLRPNLRTTLDLGFPSALRMQIRPWAPPIWAEASLGAYGPWPFYRVGARLESNLLEGRDNTIQIRPALGMAYFPEVRAGYRHRYRWDDAFDHDQAWVLTADVELVWRHRWWKQFHTEFGITVGAGYNLNSRTHQEWVTVLPHLALSFGFQF